MNKLEWTYRNDEKGIRLEATDGHHDYKIERNIVYKGTVIEKEIGHTLFVNGRNRSAAKSAANLIELSNEISQTEKEMREVAQ